MPCGFVDWRETFAPAPVPRRRFGSREGQGGPKRPALLRSAQAAAAWMEAGIADDPAPLQALLAAIALLARGGPAGTVFVPVWAAYPAVGFGDRAALPTPPQRCRRPSGRPRPAGHLAAGVPAPRRRKRPQGSAHARPARGRGGAGQGLASGGDKRSRLPDVSTPCCAPRC
jgi:hypothetical protein